jgi:CRP-like cAMP-binding protein
MPSAAFDFLRRERDIRSFPAGAAVFEDGSAGDCMFAVIEGEVDIMKGGAVIENVKAGMVFGEMALIDRSPRSATAVARTDCQLAAVNERRFTFLVQETPFFALEIMRVLAERLRRNTHS